MFVFVVKTADICVSPEDEYDWMRPRWTRGLSCCITAAAAVLLLLQWPRVAAVALAVVEEDQDQRSCRKTAGQMVELGSHMPP